MKFSADLFANQAALGRNTDVRASASQSPPLDAASPELVAPKTWKRVEFWVRSCMWFLVVAVLTVDLVATLAPRLGLTW